MLTKIRISLNRIFYSLFPVSKRAHFEELRARLRQMPFIYKPLGDKHFGENLLADFVQMRMRPIDLTTLESDASLYDFGGSYYDDAVIFDLRSTYEMVRCNRTCVIFGHAGVGKTTFASYSVLSVVDRLIVSGFYPFNPTEHLIPFIVPLKVVDELEQYPIFSYLLRSNRYLASWRGAEKLIKLCRKGKVLIVLDGYDEVYGAANSASALRAEIDAIFEGNIPRSAVRRPIKKAEDFYYHLAHAGNRVWLTTRKDFYRQNRLFIESKLALNKRMDRWFEARYKGMRPEIGYTSVGEPGIASIEILGVLERAELARRIFGKYRAVDSTLELDEQDFLNFVDSYYDDETRKLSLNPLFLTVMCYVYVQNKIGETHTDGNTLRDLVSECVSLLVQELDLQRVRLPMSHAGKALKDRLAFPKEKIGFLRYFASRCFYQKFLLQQKVFTERDLIEATTAYAKTLADGNTSYEIAKQPAAFIKQLTYQGVFVVVDETVNKTFYDFPHRRFREILAVQYWDNEETVAECLSMIAEPHFAEFILVFFATSLKFKEALLREMLNGIDGTQRGDYLADLVGTCLDKSHPSPSLQKTIGRWIQRVAKERILSELPTGIIRHFIPDEELVARFFLQLGESKSSGDQDTLRLYATFLAQISPNTTQELLRELVSVDKLDVSQTVCEVILVHRREFAPALLRELEDEEFNLLSNVAISIIAATERQWWLKVMRALPPQRLSSLKGKAARNASKVASCLVELETRDVLMNEIIKVLSSQLTNAEIIRKSEACDPQEMLAIQRNRLLPVEVLFEQDFLNSTDLCSVEQRLTEAWIARSIQEFLDQGEREFIQKRKHLGKRIIVGETVRIADQRID